ncbi:hypothetical protein VP01_3655g1 [Puccinia sorghi]|uniref:RNase H type-1 domain-containing protein n=1 Tax=Puccinia sorghi TaxID=27349 RepID=A0A0L6UUG7_9BASI|nr:hypothetical protein VP01_3655g1 [Puccinia sorghi]
MASNLDSLGDWCWQLSLMPFSIKQADWLRIKTTDLYPPEKFQFLSPQSPDLPKVVSPILRSELTDHKPSFPSPLHSLLAAKYPYRFLDEKMEKILPSPIPPCSLPQVQSKLDWNTMVIFVDGSWIPETWASAAAVMHGSDKKLTVSLPCHEVITNFKAELTGIHLAAILAQEVTESDIDQATTGVSIFCDNQEALLRSACLIGCVAGQALAVTNFFSLKTLSTPVFLYWSPGHEGLEANKLADLLAKEAVNNTPDKNNTNPIEPLLLASLSKARQRCKTNIFKGEEESQFSSDEIRPSIHHSSAKSVSCSAVKISFQNEKCIGSQMPIMWGLGNGSPLLITFLEVLNTKGTLQEATEASNVVDSSFIFVSQIDHAILKNSSRCSLGWVKYRNILGRQMGGSSNLIIIIFCEYSFTGFGLILFQLNDLIQLDFSVLES